MPVMLKVFAICILFTITECDPIYSSKDPTRQLFYPCIKGDQACLKVSTQLAIQKLIPGIPPLGIKTSDPIKHKEISGTFRKFAYNFTDVTSTGLKNCIINSIKLKLEIILEVELLCVNLTFSGKYDVHGELAGKKINDASKFVTRTSTYLLGVIAKVNQVLGHDGKKHLKLVNIVTYSTALGRVRVSLDDRDDLEKFLDSIWKLNTKLVDQAFIDAILNYLVSMVNELLKNIAVDDLFNKKKGSLWESQAS